MAAAHATLNGFDFDISNSFLLFPRLGPENGDYQRIGSRTFILE